MLRVRRRRLHGRRRPFCLHETRTVKGGEQNKRERKHDRTASEKGSCEGRGGCTAVKTSRIEGGEDLARGVSGKETKHKFAPFVSSACACCDAVAWCGHHRQRESMIRFDSEFKNGKQLKVPKNGALVVLPSGAARTEDDAVAIRGHDAPARGLGS